MDNMQFHDQFWKEELSKFRGEIAAISIGDNSEAEVFFKAERPILYSAFIIRKLIEDTAVTDRLKSRSLSVLSCPSTRNGRPFFLETMLGPLDVEKEFDLDAGIPERINYFDLTSELIHSDGLIFSSGTDCSFLVFSYRNSLKRALWVPLIEYIDVIEDVISDSPKKWYSVKDLETGKITRHAE